MSDINQGPSSPAPEEQAMESGNIDLDMLSGIFAKRNTEEPTEPENVVLPEDPEDPDPELDPEDPEDPEAEIDPEDPEDPELDPEDDPEQDVLSNYEIDWDNIPAEHAMEMNRRLGGNFHRRIDQLVATNKQLEAQLEAAKQDQPQNTTPTELAKIDSLESLQGFERDLTKRDREISRILRRKEQINDDGDEYLYEEDGKYYTREDIEGWQDYNATQLDAIPEYRQTLAQKEKKAEESNKLADKFFPELSDPNSVFSERYENLKSNPEYADIFSRPDAKYLAGIWFLGEQVLQNSIKGTQKPTTKKPTKQRPKAPVPAEGAAPPRTTSKVKKQKALDSAKNQIQESGIDGLANYFKLQQS